jgi:hypothetical protein
MPSLLQTSTSTNLNNWAGVVVKSSRLHDHSHFVSWSKCDEWSEPLRFDLGADIAEKMQQRQAIAATPQNRSQYPAGTSDMTTYGYDQNAPEVNPGAWSAPNQTSAWQHPMQPQTSYASSTPQTPIQNAGYTHFGIVQQTPVSNRSYTATTVQPEVRDATINFMIAD